MSPEVCDQKQRVDFPVFVTGLMIPSVSHFNDIIVNTKCFNCSAIWHFLSEDGTPIQWPKRLVFISRGSTTLGGSWSAPRVDSVSYTHLDVYKRQAYKDFTAYHFKHVYMSSFQII